MSSPRACSCSKVTAASRKSSRRARKRATTTRVVSASATRSRKEATRARRSRRTSTSACSRTLTAGACRWVRPTVGGGFGVSAPAAIFASCSGVTDRTSSGSREAKRGSRPAWRGTAPPWLPIRVSTHAATSLKARYCSSLAKRRSRASMSARSSASSSPVRGRRRAALRSSRVAATRRNSEACERSHCASAACWARMWAMNSSVTWANAISVMSSLCLEMRPRRRSNGPEKTSRCTSKALAGARRVSTPPGVCWVTDASVSAPPAGGVVVAAAASGSAASATGGSVDVGASTTGGALRRRRLG